MPGFECDGEKENCEGGVMPNTLEAKCALL